jgi:hypothetical protein
MSSIFSRHGKSEKNECEKEQEKTKTKKQKRRRNPLCMPGISILIIC